jgi:formamidopyrimidine-DNA glycosylase
MLKLHGDCQKMDIYGKKGQYRKKMHGKLKDKLCPLCGSKTAKQVNITGMTVYYCPECQPYKE